MVFRDFLSFSPLSQGFPPGFSLTLRDVSAPTKAAIAIWPALLCFRLIGAIKKSKGPVVHAPATGAGGI
jgi:hypothetical protein